MSKELKYNKDYGDNSCSLKRNALEKYQKLLANQFARDNEPKGVNSAYHRLFMDKKVRERNPAMYTAWWDSVERRRGIFKHRHPTGAAGGYIIDTSKAGKVPFPPRQQDKHGELERWEAELMSLECKDIRKEPCVGRVSAQRQTTVIVEPDLAHLQLSVYPIVFEPEEVFVRPVAARRRTTVFQPDLGHVQMSMEAVAFEEQQNVTVESSTPQTDTTTTNTLEPRPSSPSLLYTGSFEEFCASFMDRLQVRPQETTSLVKVKAFEDARKVQAQVIDECKKKGKDPPPYVLEELIGKGSFGRVYRGKDMKTAAIVAVKIIDIDESDTLNPRQADSYAEFLKEVNALRLLSENNAKNINHVLEALPVGKAMWMITEYCGGGSVATLMKPTSPGGLNEKWIIPILREVALALKYVHEVGIIHRDIKAGNILVTEQGNVQLCDFGVAGIVESKMDKRSTIIGTPHWMAPEMFSKEVTSYGTEVDIWAFGCMAYEIATGSPPYGRQYPGMDQLVAAIQSQTPRLEDTDGSQFSDGLKSLVAFCIQEDPQARPTIEEVQKHAYLLGTESAYPASSLRSLVGSFKVWEARGGSRKSLFFQHGAQPSAPSAAPVDEGWIFSTTANFDQEVSLEYGVKDIIDAYGPDAVIGFEEEPSLPSQRQQAKPSRRRPPPEALARLPAPLEKIFDPNTMSNYEENSRLHYGGAMQPPPTSDLPLRDDSAQTSIRDTMIDLDGPEFDSGPSTFHDMDTIRAQRRVNDSIDGGYGAPDFNRPALSDPADVNPNRQTRDWKFPSMAPPASADPEMSRFPPSSWDLPRPAVTPGSGGPGGRPALVHHPTEPVGGFGGGLQQPSLPSDRLSVQSLIDLDMADTTEYRPSTANSDAASTMSDHPVSANPFDLEKHAMYQPGFRAGREPSIYVTEDSSNTYELRNGNGNGNEYRDIGDMSDYSASDVEGTGHDYVYDNDSYYAVNTPPNNSNGNGNHPAQASNGARRVYDSMAMPPPARPDSQSMPRDLLPYVDPTTNIPSLPEAIPVAALTGKASQSDMTYEIRRMMNHMSGQLGSFKDLFQDSDLVQKKRGSTRRDPSSLDEE